MRDNVSKKKPLSGILCVWILHIASKRMFVCDFFYSPVLTKKWNILARSTLRLCLFIQLCFFFIVCFYYISIKKFFVKRIMAPNSNRGQKKETRKKYRTPNCRSYRLHITSIHKKPETNIDVQSRPMIYEGLVLVSNILIILGTRILFISLLLLWFSWCCYTGQKKSERPYRTCRRNDWRG